MFSLLIAFVAGAVSAAVVLALVLVVLGRARRVPYTKEKMLAEIRAHLNEPSPQFFSDTEINGWINDGLRYLNQLDNAELSRRLR